MTAFISKPFHRGLLPELLSLVTKNALSRWPGVSYMMNSDIAWRLPDSSPGTTLRLWYDGDIDNPNEDNIAGYAWLTLNSPVGTRPAFRRQGLGQQVNYEGLRRMKQKGMFSAKISTAGFNDRAFGLYRACGFELIDKQRTFVKTDI